MRNSLKSRIQNKIKRSSSSVFMINDFKRISSDTDQIRRALRQLIAENIILRVGKGVYVRAVASRFSGNIVPEEDIRTIAVEVIERSGGEVKLTPEQLAYNERQTTQVPNMFFVGTNKRISRKIRFKGAEINYVMVK